MEISKAVAKWMRIALKVASSMLGANGFALLLYSVWMAKVCLAEGRTSWFLLACLIVGSCLCATAFFGYSIAADFGKHDWLTYHLIVMLVFLIVEMLVGADVKLNSDWQKDFPKDRSGLFKDFVDYVNDHGASFRFIWMLFLLSQVTSFAIAANMKFARARLELSVDTKVPIEDGKPSSVSGNGIDV